MATIMADLALRISANAADLKREVEQVKKSVGGMTDMTKNLAKFAAGFFTIGAAMEFAKKSINSTSGSADKFEETMGSLKLATDKFFSSVASGDFSNLIQNLKDAAEAGREYAAALDQIEERRLGMTLEKSIADPEQKARMEVFRDREQDPNKRKNALAQYKAVALDFAAKELAIAEKAVVAEEKKLKRLKLEPEFLKLLYKNYSTQLPLIESVGEKLAKAKDIMKQMTAESSKQIPSYKKVKELGAELLAIKSNMTAKEKLYLAALQTNDATAQENITKYITAMALRNTAEAAFSDIELETLRVENQISKEIKDQATDKEKAAMAASKANPIKAISTKNLNVNSKYPVLSNELSGAPDTLGNIDNLVKMNEQLEKMEYLGLMAGDAIYGLTESFSQLAMSGKLSMKSLVGATLDGIRQMMVAKFAMALANAISNALSPNPQNIATGGLWGLGAMAAGITAVSAVWASLPKFASGTSFASGGLSLVGERGPELVSIPRGSQVYSNRQTNSMMGGEVIFRIQGTELVGILNKQAKINYA